MENYYRIHLIAQTHMAARREEAQRHQLVKEAQQGRGKQQNTLLTGLGRLLIQTGQQLQALDHDRPSDLRLEPLNSHR